MIALNPSVASFSIDVQKKAKNINEAIFDLDLGLNKILPLGASICPDQAACTRQSNNEERPSYSQASVAFD